MARYLKFVFCLTAFMWAAAHGQGYGQFPPPGMTYTPSTGFTIGTPTGGAMGAGTINIAGTYYVNGMAVGGGSNIIAGPCGTPPYFAFEPTGTTPSGVAYTTDIACNGNRTDYVGAADAVDTSYTYATPLFHYGISENLTAWSAGSYPVALALQANIGSLTSGAGGEYSFVPMLAHNSNNMGWTAITLANDQYNVGASNPDVSAPPNNQYCCSNSAAGMFSIYYFGSGVTGGGYISSLPSGSAAWAGTINSDPFCIGTYQHCIMLMEGHYSTFTVNPGINFPTGDGFAITATPGGTSGAGQYAFSVTDSGVAGNSGGIHVVAGTNSSDYALKVQSQAGGLLLYVDGAGDVYTKAPSGMSNYNVQNGAVGGFSVTSNSDFSGGAQTFNAQVATSGPISCITFNGSNTYTSASTTFSVTGLPAGMAGGGAGLIVLEDNGIVQLGSYVKSGTTITFSNGISPGIAFTSSGTKGLPQKATICWNDN